MIEKIDKILDKLIELVEVLSEAHKYNGYGTLFRNLKTELEEIRDE